MNNQINAFYALLISSLGYITISMVCLGYMEDYQLRIDSMWEENVELRERLASMVHYETTVTATMYRPRPEETDDTPTITADGTIIDAVSAHTHRYVALSRDLLSRWGVPFDYGDYIIIENAGDHSGIWQVRDTMAPRWTKRVDFLMSINHKPFKYEDVVIRSHKQIDTAFLY